MDAPTFDLYVLRESCTSTKMSSPPGVRENPDWQGKIVMSIDRETEYLVQFHSRPAAMKLGNPKQLDNNEENLSCLPEGTASHGNSDTFHSYLNPPG